MLVENLLSAARARPVSVADDAPLITVAKRLRAGTDLVVVCNTAGLLAGVITKTDVVGQIGHCQGSSCTTAVSLVMDALQMLLKEVENEESLLRDYVMCVGYH